MGLLITASGAIELSEGVWGLDMPPHQVRMFGNAASSKGPKSILLVHNASFDQHMRELRFDADGAMPLNIGTDAVTIAVASDAVVPSEAAERISDTSASASYGPGDNEFLQLIRELLPHSMQKAAASLLEGVRARSAGDLKRGKSKNFSETPDNFWYVIVQPRVEQLSITVRGPLEHFEGIARLPIKDDRGNTLFKVKSEEDVPAALELIFHAKRKR